MRLTLTDKLLLLFAVSCLGVSYWGTYRLGKSATYKTMIPLFVKEVEKAYYEGYDDGMTQQWKQQREEEKEDSENVNGTY